MKLFTLQFYDVLALIEPKPRQRPMELSTEPNGMGHCVGLCAVCTVLSWSSLGLC